MPYERTDSKLEDFLTKAIRNEEIQDGARRAQLEDAYLEHEFRDIGLEERSPKTWGVATNEIEAYDQLENTYDAYLKELRREEQQMRRSYRRIPRWAIVTILVTLSPLLLPFLLVLLRGLANIGLLSSPVTPGSLVSGIGPLHLVIVLLVTIAVLSLYIGGCRYLYRWYSASKREYESRLADIQRELAISALGERLKIAEQTVEKTVIDKGIIPELRSIVNKHLASYDTSLAISTYRGLAQGFDPDQEITTELRKKIASLLNIMPGGSIGIAGLRGDENTTLLRSFCNRPSNPELADRPVLSVMTTPTLVEFDAHEFIRLLFSSVCQRALELKNSTMQDPWESLEELQRPFSTFLPRAIGFREALASVLVGLLLIVSNSLANLLTSSSSNLFGLGLFFVMLGLVGLVVLATVQRRPQRGLGRLRANERYRDEPLIALARRWLVEMRFQLNFSLSRAGSFQGTIAPIAVGVSADAAVSLAQKQASLPEIVKGYHKFIEVASKEYLIVIGIHGLEEIESHDQTQRFLSTLRALFGPGRWFYLISISESAMSTFNQSELPLHDMFGSSFDAIYHADDLNLEKAQRLLERRVIGVPVPFLDFCYCMVGGLPRDLIRVLRELFHLSDSHVNDLWTLCDALIRADLKRKLRATSIAAKDTMLEVKQPFDRIRQVETLLGRTDHLLRVSLDLLEISKDLLVTTSDESARQADSAEVAPERNKTASLSAEFGVYLYYSITLLEFFAQEDFSAETLQAAESSGALERLASTRQWFAISPRMAELGITDFREAHNMSIP